MEFSSTRPHAIRHSVPVADEWYRGSDWSTAARQEFERRLTKARAASRAQYLRIKAVSLFEAGDLKAADSLMQRILDEYPDSFEAPLAREVLGDIAARQGRLSDAAEQYRGVIQIAPDLNTTSGQVHTKLAEVLFRLDATAHGVEIAQELREGAEQLRFNSDIFRWSVINARFAAACGDEETMRASARRALDAAEAGPQLSRHPTVGLVHAPDPTLAWLRRIASG